MAWKPLLYILYILTLLQAIYLRDIMGVLLQFILVKYSFTIYNCVLLETSIIGGGSNSKIKNKPIMSIPINYPENQQRW
jgi:hypothetical protein